VCSALAQEDWAASLTRDGVERTDVLAVHSETREMVEVQVKTSATHAKPSWRLGEVPLARSEREWYVLVALGGSVRERPRCFVVPRDHVAAGAWINHNAWLTAPDVPAGKRNAPMSHARAGVEVWNDYEERWELLRERGDEVPVFLPSWMREASLLDRIGLPPEHPWRGAMPAEGMWRAGE
jgi:hypothetical protein